MNLVIHNPQYLVQNLTKYRHREHERSIHPNLFVLPQALIHQCLGLLRPLLLKKASVYVLPVHVEQRKLPLVSVFPPTLKSFRLPALVEIKP